MSQYEKISNEFDFTYIKWTDAEGKVYSIPMDESNSDYQRYLRWLENPDAEEGGTL